MGIPAAETVIGTPKFHICGTAGQLLVCQPECHGARIPARLWTRITQRLLAVNAVIWRNWAIGMRVKRSPAAYDY